MPVRARTAVSVGIVGLALALSACTGGGDGTPVSDDCTPVHEGLDTITEGTLTVAAYVSPPYTIEAEGTIQGIDGEIVAALARMECLSLDITSVTGAALPSMIDSERADIAIGGVYASPEREQTFSLTTSMYLDRVALLSRNGVSSLEGLDGMTLGVVQGYLWNEQFQNALGGDNVSIYQTSASLITDINNGRVDAGAFTSAEASIRAEGSELQAALLDPTPEIPSTEQPNNVVLLLNQNATALTDALNEDIEDLLADGTIADIVENNGVDPSLAATDHG